MRDNELKKSEEFLCDYIDVIEEAQAAEFSKFMNDESIEEEKEARKRSSKSSRKPNRLIKYAAIFIAAVAIAGAVVPVEEVSAWVIWKFDAIFGEHPDHTEIKPNDEKDFLQYYVEELPDGFDIISEKNQNGGQYIQYANSAGKYIIYNQVKREHFVSNYDNENHENNKEMIADFEVLVSEGENDISFEIITEFVIISVHTDAGYDVGVEFIRKLKEL